MENNGQKISPSKSKPPNGPQQSRGIWKQHYTEKQTDGKKDTLGNVQEIKGRSQETYEEDTGRVIEIGDHSGKDTNTILNREGR
ncbi:unnamed protein product, partial [Ilex paraguariensis]